MSRITSFEEACKVLNIDPAAVLPNVSAFPEKHQKALTATAKLFVIADALNEEWEPDWNEDEQYKYYPWFDLEKHKKNNPSGFRLGGVGCSCGSSAVGSRLCFKDRETAEYAATRFIDLYRDLMVL
jgi:hypothetical protein